jgi:hypothetical protein
MSVNKFKTPHKPDDMTLWDWQAICRRSNPPECENLVSGICQSPCGSEGEDGFIPLDLDHIQSRALGGVTNAANCRLICANGSEHANRNRGAASDPRWQRDFWFDRRNSFDGLRKAQMYAGPQNIEAYQKLFTEQRDELCRYISLLAMTTGSGKTMLIVATLLAINDIVLRTLGKAPRVGHPLYFVSEKALADQLEKELREEVTKFGLHLAPPAIQKCTEKGDLERGPGSHDFTISCPHALWARKDQSRTDSEIAQTLSQYDTIIWDECDFAAGQVDRLVKLAPHALKFGLTATPIDGDGDFLKLFTVATVASYRTVFDLDKCLKIVPTWLDGKAEGFIRPVDHGGATIAVNGVNEEIDGTHGDKCSLPGASNAIRMAIEESAELERQMQAMMPDDWYSPHILVRCASVAEAEHLAGQTEQFLTMRGLPGYGWRTSIIYADGPNKKLTKRPIWENGSLAHKKIEECERSLIHCTGRLSHPWMRAKERLNGRCDDDQSARILFVVDMGIRGLNNWTCLYEVDVARSASVSVQSQLRGRMDRIGRLGWILQQERTDLYRFITVRYFYPEAGGGAATMERAYDWLHKMDENFDASGLRTWAQLVDGVIDADQVRIQPLEEPFTLGDRIQIDDAIGRRLEDGAAFDDIDAATIDAIIESLPPELTERRRDMAREHIDKVLNDADYRREQVELPIVDPISAVQLERPKRPDQYSTEELIEFVKNSPDYQDLSAEFVEEIVAGKATTRRVLGKAKYDMVARFYVPPVKIWSLQTDKQSRDGGYKSVIGHLADPVASDLHKRHIFESWGQAQGAVRKAISQALMYVFNVDDVSNNGPLDTPGYHHKIVSPSVQRIIKDVAYRIMLRNGDLGAASSLYGQYRNG